MCGSVIGLLMASLWEMDYVCLISKYALTYDPLYAVISRKFHRETIWKSSPFLSSSLVLCAAYNLCFKYFIIKYAFNVLLLTKNLNILFALQHYNYSVYSL